MIIFIAHAVANCCNAPNKGKAAPVNAVTAYVTIEHLTKREEREMPLKILSIKALEWCLIYGIYKVLL